MNDNRYPILILQYQPNGRRLGRPLKKLTDNIQLDPETDLVKFMITAMSFRYAQTYGLVIRVYD